MLKTRLRLGTVFGIPIHIDVSWLLIFIWVTWSLAGNYFPQRYPTWSRGLDWGMGVITSLLFFTSVLLHELGHSLVARSQGTPVKDITLFIFGGVSEISDEPTSPGREFFMAITGPLVSLALAALFGAIYLIARSFSAPLAALGLYLGGINLSLGLFNLIPGFPLDGGRVLRSILWRLGHNLATATRWASRVGQIVAYLFILGGILLGFSGDWVSGVWIAFIGLFLDNAARSAYMQLTLRQMLDGHTVAEVMSQECTLVPSQLTLDVLVEQYIVGTARRCFTVGDGNHVVGLLTLHSIRDVPKARWPETRVAAIFTPLNKVKVVSPVTPLWEALEQMTTEGVNQVPVLEKGELVGMLTREHLLTFIRNHAGTGIEA